MRGLNGSGPKAQQVGLPQHPLEIPLFPFRLPAGVLRGRPPCRGRRRLSLLEEGQAELIAVVGAAQSLEGSDLDEIAAGGCEVVGEPGGLAEPGREGFVVESQADRPAGVEPASAGGVERQLGIEGLANGPAGNSRGARVVEDLEADSLPLRGFEGVSVFLSALADSAVDRHRKGQQLGCFFLPDRRVGSDQKAQAVRYSPGRHQAQPILSRSGFGSHLQLEGNPLPGANGFGLPGGIVPGLFGFEGFDPLDACRQPLLAEQEGVASVEVLAQDLDAQAVAGPRPQRVDGADFRLRRRGLLRGLGPKRAAGGGKASQEDGCGGQAPEPAVRFSWEHPATHGMNGPILAPVHRRC